MFAEKYKEVCVASVIIDDGQGGMTVKLPDGVTYQMMNVAVKGANFYTSPITAPAVIGSKCIAHVVCDKDSCKLIKADPMCLGNGFQVTQKVRYSNILGTTEPMWAFLAADYNANQD